MSLNDPNCRLCGLYQGATSVCVPGDGDLLSTLLVVGIAPGMSEDIANRVFNGKSGKLLREVLSENHLVPYITNIVNCRPVDSSQENRDPTAKEIEVCRVYLLSVVQSMPNLKYVVALGSLVMKSFKVPGGVVDLAGIPRQGTSPDGRQVTVIPVAHPTYLLRQPKYDSTWNSHWHQVKQIVSPPEKSMAETVGAVLLPKGLEGRDWRTL